MELRAKHFDAIRELATSRCNYEEIAVKLQIDSRTLRRWRLDPDFQAALKRKMEEPKDAQRLRGTVYRILGGMLARLESAGPVAPTPKTMEMFARLAREFKLLDLGVPDKEADRVARMAAVQRALRRKEQREERREEHKVAAENAALGIVEREDEWDPEYLRDPRAWHKRERELRFAPR